MIRKVLYLVLAGVLLLGLTAIPIQAATPEDIEASIEKGLEWLVTQQQPGGEWSFYAPIALTGFALVKLCDRAYETGYSPFDAEYEYMENVVDGFDYLFSQASPAGVGIAFDIGWYENYCTGIAAMAIGASRTPDRLVPTGPCANQTYKQVLQAVVDYFAWGQVDAPSPQRGGWSYHANDDWADQSNTGYSVLGLRYAEAELYGFQCNIPQVVKDEHTMWVNFNQNPDGGSDYDGTEGWSNLLRTGNLLFEQSFVGITIDDPRVEAAIGYIESNWNPSADSQTMYCLMKGFMSYGIETITVGGNPVDWYDVFADHIIANQHPDGYWDTLGWGQELDTVWALLTLQKVAPPITATIRIEPETLNLNSKGVLTAFITLPEGLNVADIDLDTVECEGAPAVKGHVAGGHTFIAKFNRQDLVNVPTGDEVMLIVTGKLVTGTSFAGSDTIRVIDKGGK